MAAPTESPNDEILACIARVEACLKDQFVLVGGGAMSVLGSFRKTRDVDILVPSNVSIQALYNTLIDSGLLVQADGEYRFQNTETIVTLDVLTSVVNSLSFENLVPHVSRVNGIPLPNLDYALAIKVKCFYLRADNENGKQKRASDIEDVRFICKMMVQRSQTISEDCANHFKFGYYHILELRMELGPQDTENFIQIGGRKLILPWDQNSSDQQEYYTCFTMPGTDPLTAVIED